VKIKCTSFPRDRGFDWQPLLGMRISNPRRHSPPTARFSALIDSGASACLFHSSLAQAIGIDVRRGKPSRTVTMSGAIVMTYFHPIRIHIGVDALDIEAGFTDQLAVAALLGRQGFFDQYRITFDPSIDPPTFELERVVRT
jgi:hypothetical protein